MAVTLRVLQLSCRFQNSAPVRYMSKHYDPKFRWLRGKKIERPTVKFNVPGYKRTEEELKMMSRERGVFPTQVTQDLPLYVGSSSGVIDEYVPQEGDGKYSILSNKYIHKIADSTKAKAKDLYHKKIFKAYEKDFDTKSFPMIAQDIYIKAHETLASNNIDELPGYVTEYALNRMLMNRKGRTIRWKFIESLDPPQVVRVRVASLITRKNYFGQVTVRFHTKQMLAIYDRFGRLTYGSEVLAKDVLEYIVFEKHLVNVYGTWKLHHKTIPDWHPREVPAITYVERPEKSEDDIMTEEYNLTALVDEYEEEQKAEKK